MGKTSIAQGIKQIWPMITGMVFARAGLIVAGYGSYQSTDEGLYTDGAMLITLAVMFVLFIALRASKLNISARTRRWLFYICVAVEIVCIVLLSPDAAFPLPAATRLPLCTLVTLASSSCQFFWLMRMTRCGGLLAALFAFGSIAASEVEIYLCYLMGDAGYYLAAAFTALQPICRLAANISNKPGMPLDEERSYEFVGYARDVLDNNRLLCITAVGLVLLFFVDGLLRGYLTGQPIPFTHDARIANLALTIALCVVAIGVVAAGRISPMGPATYISLELLAACALLLYALFPSKLVIGAIFTTTLNALLCALMWYVTIAFMTFGWRDPYYYGLGAWIVCMGSRAVARMTIFQMHLGAADELAVNAFMFATLLASAQILLYSFFYDARKAARREVEERREVEGELRAQINELNRRLVDMKLTGNPINCANCGKCKREDAGKAAKAREGGGVISRLMGLDKPVLGEMSPASTMRERAEAVGRQFLLSEREVEVLSYYAMGWTQKRVAEELFIQPATVHAHIKRIYAKTGLHSRQEVLDFMEEYLG